MCCCVAVISLGSKRLLRSVICIMKGGFNPEVQPPWSPSPMALQSAKRPRR